MPSARTTIADLVPSWERSLRAANVSPHTLRGYLASLKRLRRYLHDHDLPDEVTQITKAHLQAFVVDLLARGKPSSALTRWGNVVRFFAFCVEEGELTASPMTGIKPPRVPEVPPTLLTDDQLRALLKACEGPGFFERRDLAIIRLLIDTGLRRSELCDLRVQDVDLIAGEATIWHGKFDRKRIVAFQSKASAALDRYMRLRGQHPDHELPNLWLGRAGPLTHTTIYRIVKERAAKAGIGHVWTHLFRHTAAHAWLAAGGSELGLMEIAGWRDRKMLSKYGAELKSERARDEARRLDLGDRL